MSVGSTIGYLGLDHALTHALSGANPASGKAITRLFFLAAAAAIAAAGVVLLAVQVLKTPLAITAVLLGVIGFSLAQFFARGALALGASRLVASARILAGGGYLTLVWYASASGASETFVIWGWVGVGWVLTLVTTFPLVRVRSTPGSADVSVPSLVSIGLPAWHASIAQAITYRLDQLVMMQLLGPVALGQYSVAVFAMSSLWLIPDTFGDLEYPKLIPMSIADRTERVRKLVRNLSLSVGVLGVAAVAVSPFVIPALVGDGYGSVPVIMLLLLPGTILMSGGKGFGAGLLAGRRAEGIRSSALRGAIVAAIVTLPAVAWGGQEGAAVAASVIYGLIAFFLRSAFAKTEEA
jgi:O-antigen/teichoic acid export membrane protein